MTAVNGTGDVRPLPGLTDRPARLADPVIWDLCQAIVSGRISQGESMPGEPELSAMYGVSRTVVREVVQSLQKRGLVQVKQGQKTSVLSDNEWNLLDPLVLDAMVQNDDNLSILDDLIEVRVVLEEQMAARAARDGTLQDFERLRQVLAAMNAALGSPAEYWALDTQFHDTFMVASGNKLARSVVRAIHEKARGSTHYNGTPDNYDIQLGHRGHVEICGHITARQPAAAAKAVREHILGSWERRKLERPAADWATGRADTPRLARARRASNLGHRLGGVRFRPARLLLICERGDPL